MINFCVVVVVDETRLDIAVHVLEFHRLVVAYLFPALTVNTFVYSLVVFDAATGAAPGSCMIAVSTTPYPQELLSV